MYCLTFGYQVISGRWTYPSLARMKQRTGTWDTTRIRWYGAASAAVGAGFACMGYAMLADSLTFMLAGFLLLGVGLVGYLVLELRARQAGPRGSSPAEPFDRGQQVRFALAAIACVLLAVGMPLALHQSWLMTATLLLIGLGVLARRWRQLHGRG